MMKETRKEKSGEGKEGGGGGGGDEEQPSF